MDVLEHPPIPAPNYPPSAQDWELHRPIITRLYRDDDKPLREVMDSMRRSGFRATSKMYKSRIQTWGLDKKLKENEARAIICMLAHHRGKASYIRLRDRRVEIKAAVSHLKRKGIAISDVLTTDAPHVSNLIICDTAETSENGVPRCLASPEPFKTTELLCADVREYILSSFGTGRWLSQRLGRYSESSVEEKIQAAKYVQTVDPAGAIEQSQMITSMSITELIECQAAEHLPLIIQLIALLLWRPSVGLILSRLICSKIANHDFGDSHVNTYMQRIFTRIGQLALSNEIPGYLLAVMRSTMDSHEHVLGQYHPQTLYTTVILSQMMCLLYGPDGLSKPLEVLLASLESQQGPGTLQSMMLQAEMRRLE